MQRQHPSQSDVDPIRKAMEFAWKDVLPPKWDHFITDDVDSREARDYLRGREINNVDLFDKRIAQESPLFYLEPSATLYYLPAYLKYMLSIEKHLSKPAELVGDYPAIHLIYYLCSSGYVYPAFSAMQIIIVLDILSLIKQFPSFYCCNDDESMSTIEKGIIKWKKLLQAARIGNSND